MVLTHVLDEMILFGWLVLAFYGNTMIMATLCATTYDFSSPSPPRDPREEKGPGDEEAGAYGPGCLFERRRYRAAKPVECLLRRIVRVPARFQTKFRSQYSSGHESKIAVVRSETFCPIRPTSQTVHTSSSPNPFSSRGGDGELEHQPLPESHAGDKSCAGTIALQYQFFNSPDVTLKFKWRLA